MKLYYSVKHIFLKVRAIWKTTWKYGLKDKLMWAKRTEIQPDQRFLDKYGSLSSLHRIFFCFKHSCVGPEKVFYNTYMNSFCYRYVWPWAKNISIAHDSYLCKKYPFTKAFPTERKHEPNNFVGSVVTSNLTLWQTCPEECRPKNHLDWIYC